jgi:uncharacterized membrane protein YadS
MRLNWKKAVLVALSVVISTTAEAAVDSYRFVHVTIATPWYIFIFLLMGIFAPFVLMAVLAWRNAIRKSDQDDVNAVSKTSIK